MGPVSREQVAALIAPDYQETPVVQPVELDPPQPGEVRIQMAAAGICHSDLHAIDGTLPLPMPMVLGHEGAGLVTAVGAGVVRVKPGDRVVVTWIPSCGRCYWCVNGQPELCDEANRGAVSGTAADGTTRLHWRGAPIHPFSWAGTLAEAAVVPETLVVRIPPTLPWTEAALLGCAVQTGVGAALRAPIRPGDAVLVVGLGGVGQNIVQGARIAGAARILAADPIAAKRRLAQDLGATDPVDPAEGNLVEQVLDRTRGRGVDVAFEAVGIPDLLAAAFNATRKGGTTVAVGVPSPERDITLNAFAFVSQEKTLTGSWLGGSYPPRDVPRLIRLWQAGALRLAPLIAGPYALDEAPAALAALRRGEVVRPVIRFPAVPDVEASTRPDSVRI